MPAFVKDAGLGKDCLLSQITLQTEKQLTDSNLVHLRNITEGVAFIEKLLPESKHSSQLRGVISVDCTRSKVAVNLVHSRNDGR